MVAECFLVKCCINCYLPFYLFEDAFDFMHFIDVWNGRENAMIWIIFGVNIETIHNDVKLDKEVRLYSAFQSCDIH